MVIIKGHFTDTNSKTDLFLFRAVRQFVAILMIVSSTYTSNSALKQYAKTKTTKHLEPLN